MLKSACVGIHQLNNLYVDAVVLLARYVCM